MSFQLKRSSKDPMSESKRLLFRANPTTLFIEFKRYVRPCTVFGIFLCQHRVYIGNWLLNCRFILIFCSWSFWNSHPRTGVKTHARLRSHKNTEKHMRSTGAITNQNIILISSYSKFISNYKIDYYKSSLSSPKVVKV